MLKRLLLSFTALYTVFSMGFSQSIILSGEFRPRTEYAHGFKTLASKDQNSGFFTTQRSRINLSYSGLKSKSYISVQDVRTWGNQVQLVENEDRAISIHEAWFMPQLDKKGLWALKIGRQELVYDDHRIFGNVAWAQAARSHDAVLLKYMPNDKSKLDIALAYNQDFARLNSNLYTTANYKTMQMLWYHSSVDKFNYSLLFMNLGFQVSGKDSLNKDIQDTKFNQTVGTHFDYSHNKFTVTGNIFYQLGKQASLVEKDISAYLLGLEAQYSVLSNHKLSLGYELQSGNSQKEASDKNKAFNPYYGTNHKFNGTMDYFYVGNHINSVGLQDIYAKWNAKLKKFNLGADLHLFSAAADILNPANADVASKNLGTELDIYLDFSFSENVKCLIGYSQMLATESMQYLKGGKYDETQNWAFIMLTYNPVFFKHETIKN